MWFDPLTAWAVSLFTTGVPLVKEKTGQIFEQTIPAESWANKELLDKDRASGMSQEQILYNVKNGRYIMSVQYPVPHRDATSGKTIIENEELYREDVIEHGAYQAQKWVKQGKYNLNVEELEIVQLQIERKYQHLYSIGSSEACYQERMKEIDAILATKKWDCKNTEAVHQWQKAHDANIGRYE